MIIAAIVVVVLVIAFSVLFARLALVRHPRFQPEESDPLFAPKRYVPLQRLLDPNDEKFLAAHGRHAARMRTRFRKRRIRIFRGYLHELSTDFHAICVALKLTMMSSSEDRRDLVRVLVREQRRFSRLRIVVEWKLVLYRLGLSPVDARVLIDCVDAMRAELQSMALQVQPTLA